MLKTLFFYFSFVKSKLEYESLVFSKVYDLGKLLTFCFYSILYSYYCYNFIYCVIVTATVNYYYYCYYY